MRSSKRRDIALLVAFECLLLLVALAEYGAQGDAGQDQPIAFDVILVLVLAAGNVLALLIAVLSHSGALLRKRLRSRRRRGTRAWSNRYSFRV